MKSLCVMADKSRLTKVPNSYMLCSVQTHQQLLKVAHLFPENCFVGQKEMLPGLLAVGQKHPKSGGKNLFLFYALTSSASSVHCLPLYGVDAYCLQIMLIDTC